MAVFLTSETFTVSRPGPSRIFRPALPNCPYGGVANAAVLNHSCGPGLGSPGLPTTFGFWSFAPKPEGPDACIGVIRRRQERDREGLPGLERQHAEALPSAQQPMALEDRNIVGIAQSESLADVEVGSSAVRAQVITVLRKVRISRR